MDSPAECANVDTTVFHVDEKDGLNFCRPLACQGGAGKGQCSLVCSPG